MLMTMLMSCKGKQPDGGTDALCPLRNNQEMLDFVLKSAREMWPEATEPYEIRLEEGGEPVPTGESDDEVHYKRLLLGKEGEITVFLCRDSAEVARIKDRELYRAAGKDPYRAPILSAYGTLLMSYWGLDDYGVIGLFMNSVVLDTRRAMKKALDWQRWLASRGVTARIPEAGFSLRNESLFTEIKRPCQALAFTVGGHKTELLCFRDSATVTAAIEEIVHMAAVCDPVEGADYFIPYGRYGNILVMALLNSDSDRIEPLIAEFWNRQTF